MKKTLWLVLIVAALFVLGGCTGEEREYDEVNEKIMVIGLPAEPVTLDPHQMQDYNSIRAGRGIFDTLVEYQGDSTEVGPGLATAWDISGAGLEYVFHLRSGVLFQDGTPFNAEAVQFSLERQLDPQHPYHDTGTYPYARYALDKIKTIEAMDNHTVKITLQEPFAPFLTHLAMPTACIVSPGAVEKHGRNFARNPVGTGPYQFKSWIPGDELVLEKFDGYWGGEVGLDRVLFKAVVSDQDRVDALAEGYLDMAFNVPPGDLTMLRNNKNITVLEKPGLQVWYIAFNCQRPPFNDVRVRQAFNYAINRKALLQDVIQNAGQPAPGPLPPGVWGRNSGLAGYPYDPDRALQLLEEAGYPQGLTATCLVPENGPLAQSVAMATALQRDLAGAGIVLNIQTMDWTAFMERVFVPPHLSTVEMHMMAWTGDSGDPDNYLFSLFSGSQWPVAGFNSAYYKNQQVDGLLQQARTLSRPRERAPLYQEAQKIIMEESPWMILGYEKQIMGLHKKIKGFNPHPTGLLRLEQVDFE